MRRHLRDVLLVLFVSVTMVPPLCGQETPFAVENDPHGGFRTAAPEVSAPAPENDAVAACPQRMASILATGEAGGSLDGRLVWTATPPSDVDQSSWTVGLVAELDASGLLSNHPSSDFNIGICGYILAADGALIGQISRSYSFRAPWTTAATGYQGLRVVHHVVLPPGDYTVRMVVEETATQHYLLLVTDLAIPSVRPSPPVLLAPLVAAADDRWVTVTTSDSSSDIEGPDRANDTYLPLPRAVSVPGKPTELILVGAGWSGNLRAAARWIDANGIDRGHPSVRLAEKWGRREDGALLVHASVDTPPLPIGNYTLMMQLDDTATGSSQTRAVPVVVVAGDGEVLSASVDDSGEAPSDQPSVAVTTRDIGSISAQTAALLLSGQRGGEISGSLIWTVRPQPVDGGLAEVLIFVDSDGRTLLEENPSSELDVGVFAYVFSQDGRLVAHLAQGLRLDLQTYEEELLARGLKFAGHFILPPGDFIARLLVRNQNSGRVYLTQARIDVPKMDDDERLLLPPIFDEPRTGWILARQSSMDGGSIGVHLSDVDVLPSSRVVVRSHTQTELFLGGAGWDDTARISARVADAKGRQLAEPVVVIDHPVTREGEVVRFYRATLGPLDLPSGFYNLELILDDETSGSRLSHFLPLAVVSSSGPLILQTDLDTGGTVPLPQSSLSSAASTALSNEEFASAYAEALYVLGRGDRYGARDAVVALEKSALAAGGQRALAAIAKIERQVVHGVAATDQSVLRPISLLHRDVFRQYLANGELGLADHSWPLAAEFAEKVRDKRQPGDALAFTETVLLSLAADLVRNASVSPAIDLLKRVTDIAPDDAAALLALGATYERSGRYDEATEAFRDLVERHPDHAEGELRLAVNLARGGKSVEAEAHFQRLIDSNAPAWVTVIAYQEMSRLLPPSDAERVLREGVERYPSNQALRVELAYTLDMRGRAEEAADLVGEICRRASAPETSPRVRYPVWPSVGIESRIEALEQEAAFILPALVTALDARALENGDGAT